MKRKFIPTTFALLATCAATVLVMPTAEAQSGARQVFPWSSARAAQSRHAPTPTPASAPQRLTRAAQSFQQSATGVSEAFSSAASAIQDSVTIGETIYLDENGKQITREQLQAKLSPGEVLSNVERGSVPFEHQITNTLGNGYSRSTLPTPAAKESIWQKAKNMASSVFKKKKSSSAKLPSLKPSFFRTPEGLQPTTTRTRWGNPKISEPTTWFSREVENPITFAPVGSLPRAGQVPSNLDSPLTGSQFASAGSSSRVERAGQFTGNSSGSGSRSFSQQASSQDFQRSVFEPAQHRSASQGFQPSGSNSRR